MNEARLKELEGLARDLRLDVLEMIYRAASGHPGGSLSMVELMVALYWETLRHDPANPGWPERDRLVLSKGHGCPALYAALSRQGYLPREELLTLRQFGSRLQGHPDSKRLPGVEVSTGSLGQGLSVGAGLALGNLLAGRKSRVYVLLGDGECDEGQVWEAALFSAHRHLGNLTALVDYNGVQLDGTVPEVLDLAPLAEKWLAFGWEVEEVDGHDLKALVAALNRPATDKPRAIIARTIKGRGVSFMEGKHQWHGAAMNAQQYEQARTEVSQGTVS